MSKTEITVIVPIYHGKKYIPSLIRQVEKCAEKLKNGVRTELLLVNDDPVTPLGGYESDRIDITVLETDKNRGIQGARVYGVKNSHGEYLLFLDQDDRLMEDYLQTQLACIGENDAAVCRLIHERKPFYGAECPFDQAISKDYMLRYGCSIVSPGQVLLRKASIPSCWMENIMRHNGADDFFLWLCMFAEGKKFVRNERTVFEHIVTYDNTSWNTPAMMESEKEMQQILKDSRMFKGEDSRLLEGLTKRLRIRRLTSLDKFRKMFYILNAWIRLGEKGKTISGYLEDRGLHKAAIYGVGYLGKHLAAELMRSGHLYCLLDRNAEAVKEELQEELPVYKLEEYAEEASPELVIVTLVQGEEKVLKQVREKLGCRVITIREIIVEMENETSER